MGIEIQDGLGDGPLGTGFSKIIGGFLGEQFHDAFHILVVDHTEKDMHLTTFDGLELFAQIFPSREVMASVADGLRSLFHRLPAAFQTCQLTDILKSFFHFLVLALDHRVTSEGMHESKTFQLSNGAENGVGVLDLIDASLFTIQDTEVFRLIDEATFRLLAM